MYIGNNQRFQDDNGEHVPWDYMNNVEQVSLQDVLARACPNRHCFCFRLGCH